MKLQRGGFVMGMIVGLMAGLALALGVALYVTKVPVPFVNKVPQRTAEQDAAEAERNKNWDPNTPLYGKTPTRPTATPPAGGVVRPPPVAVLPPGPGDTATPPPPAGRDPADILAGRLPETSSTTPSTGTAADPFTYFVQVGAFSRAEDAEQQRARLAMLGFGAKVTEREQAGRTMYRVRVGPFQSKDQADSTKEKLDGSGMESSLVRVQR
jgi:cell division protein FtsN